MWGWAGLGVTPTTGRVVATPRWPTGATRASLRTISAEAFWTASVRADGFCGGSNSVVVGTLCGAVVAFYYCMPLFGMPGIARGRMHSKRDQCHPALQNARNLGGASGIRCL